MSSERKIFVTTVVLVASGATVVLIATAAWPLAKTLAAILIGVAAVALFALRFW